MASKPLAAPAARPDGSYAEAYAAWRQALEHYLALARHGAGAARLRAAAAAVHAAALRKGQLAGRPDDAGS